MGNRHSYLLIALLVLLVTPLVLSSPTYKQSTEVTLSVPCKINGEVCGPSATCVGTVLNPADIVLYNNESMTQDGAVFELNLTSDDTSTVGEYRLSISCTQDGASNSKDLTFTVSPSGNNVELLNVVFYGFLLFLCLIMIIGSGMLIFRNSITEDNISLFKAKKRSNVDFYFKIIKQKMWIVGTFGVYIFTLIALIILSRAAFDLGVEEVTGLLSNTIIIVSWGLVPFVIFWIIYLILFVYTKTEEILRYQFGGIKQ